MLITFSSYNGIRILQTKIVYAPTLLIAPTNYTKEVVITYNMYNPEFYMI